MRVSADFCAIWSWDGRECVLELGSRLSDNVWVTSGGRQFRLDASHGEDFI